MPSPHPSRSAIRTGRPGPGGLVAAALICAATAACGVPPFKQVEKRASRELAFVEGTIDRPPSVVHERLRQMASNGRTPLAEPFQHFRFEAADGGVFPDQSSLTENATDNPALQRYVALDPGERARDFYLFDVSDTFWASEYYYRGAPARFKTHFIVHLAAGRPGEVAATRVEIIEYRPVVWVGDRFGMGHAGPGFLNDIRVVAPTTQDRQLLLEQLTRALTSEPGREG